jgi:hypothetical protein
LPDEDSGSGGSRSSAATAQPDDAATPTELDSTGRDLLIPAPGPGGGRRGKAARPAPLSVPPVTDLMPRPKPAKRKKHEHHPRGTAETGARVELVVPLSKGLRKRLRAKAEEMGATPEEAVAQLVGIWVDG